MGGADPTQSAAWRKLFLKTAGVLPARRILETDAALNFSAELRGRVPKELPFAGMFKTFDAIDNYSTTPHHPETDCWYY